MDCLKYSPLSQKLTATLPVCRVDLVLIGLRVKIADFQCLHLLKWAEYSLILYGECCDKILVDFCFQGDDPCYGSTSNLWRGAVYRVRHMRFILKWSCPCIGGWKAGLQGEVEAPVVPYDEQSKYLELWKTKLLLGDRVGLVFYSCLPVSVFNVEQFQKCGFRSRVVRSINDISPVIVPQRFFCLNIVLHRRRKMW